MAVSCGCSGADSLQGVLPELLIRLAAVPLGRPLLPPLLVRPFSSGGQSRATMALKVDGRSSRHHDCHAFERKVRVRSDLWRCMHVYCLPSAWLTLLQSCTAALGARMWAWSRIAVFIE